MIDLELDLLLRKSRLEESFWRSDAFMIKDFRLRNIIHDTIHKTVMYCEVFLANGFPQ